MRHTVMDKSYQKRIDNCREAYRDIVLELSKHPGDENLEMCEASVLCDLERAFMDKARSQLLRDLRTYLSGELPF